MVTAHLPLDEPAVHPAEILTLDELLFFAGQSITVPGIFCEKEKHGRLVRLLATWLP